MTKPAKERWNKVRILGTMFFVAWFFLVAVLMLRPYDEADENDHGEFSAIVMCFLSLVFCFTFYFFGPFASIVLIHFGYFQTLLFGFLGEMFISAVMIFTSGCKNYVYANVYGVLFSIYNIITYTIIGTTLERHRPFLNNLISSLVPVLTMPVLMVIQQYTADIDYTDDLAKFNTYFFISLSISILCIGSMFVFVCLRCKVRNVNVTGDITNKKLVATEQFKQHSFNSTDSALVLLFFILACAFDYEATYLVDIESNKMASFVGLNITETYFFFGITSTLTFAISLISGVLYTRDIVFVFGVNVNRLDVLYLSFGVRFVMCMAFATVAQIHYSIFMFVYVCYSFTVGCSSALGITLLADLFGADSLCSNLGLRSIAIGTFVIFSRVMAKMPIENYIAYWVPSWMPIRLLTFRVILLAASLCSLTSIYLLDSVYKFKGLLKEKLCFENDLSELPKEVEALHYKQEESPDNYDVV